VSFQAWLDQTVLASVTRAPTIPARIPEIQKDWRIVPVEAIHRVLGTRKLVKRLKLQHAEMSRTILALENLPAKDRRRPKSPGRKARK
jgi:hypothetical protein